DHQPPALWIFEGFGDGKTLQPLTRPTFSAERVQSKLSFVDLLFPAAFLDQPQQPALLRAEAVSRFGNLSHCRQMDVHALERQADRTHPGREALQAQIAKRTLDQFTIATLARSQFFR